MTPDDQWTLELVEDDIDLSGWLFLPQGMTPDERDVWIATAASEVVGNDDMEGAPITAEGARDVLEAGLAERAAVSSQAMFQIWPSLWGVVAMCHINIVQSRELPAWEEVEDAVLHRTEAEHLGPGLQCTTRRAIEVEKDLHVELIGVHVVFDDGEVAVVLSLSESVSPLITRALPTFVRVMENLRLVRTSDGTSFASIPPEGLTAETPFPFEEFV
jgi:hypothetical protein